MLLAAGLSCKQLIFPNQEKNLILKLKIIDEYHVNFITGIYSKWKRSSLTSYTQFPNFVKNKKAKKKETEKNWRKCFHNLRIHLSKLLWHYRFLENQQSCMASLFFPCPVVAAFLFHLIFPQRVFKSFVVLSASVSSSSLALLEREPILSNWLFN